MRQRTNLDRSPVLLNRQRFSTQPGESVPPDVAPLLAWPDSTLAEVPGMKLYTYWRSQAAFRVRIALRFKGLAADKVTLDLLKGDQFAADYHALNPEGVVPTLID